MGSIHVTGRTREQLADRAEAAELLSREVGEYIEDSARAVVLGIPRGGVLLADHIARRCNAEMDVVLTRKLQAAHNPELAIGAVSEDGTLYTNEPIVMALGLSEEYIAREKGRQMETIAQRKNRYRHVLEKTPLTDKTVILTDDGVATGATMQAALWATQTESPARIILALPVAPRETLDRLACDADVTVCLLAPPDFRSISQFYDTFEQVDDTQVVEILKRHAKARHL